MSNNHRELERLETIFRGKLELLEESILKLQESYKPPYDLQEPIGKLQALVKEIQSFN